VREAEGAGDLGEMMMEPMRLPPAIQTLLSLAAGNHWIFESASSMHIFAKHGGNQPSDRHNPICHLSTSDKIRLPVISLGLKLK
jgi:hypothetical protein